MVGIGTRLLNRLSIPLRHGIYKRTIFVKSFSVMVKDLHIQSGHYLSNWTDCLRIKMATDLYKLRLRVEVVVNNGILLICKA